MKRTLSLSIALSITIALATLLVAGRANAEIVKVTVRAEINSPFLVVHPPHPIDSPSRITVEVVEPEGPRFVRIVGHHHRDHYVYVGRRVAPRYWVRTRIVEPRFIVRAPSPRIIVRAPEPRVIVRAPSPRVIVRAPSPSIHIGGPSVHIGGPHVKVRGGHHHRGRF